MKLAIQTLFYEHRPSEIRQFLRAVSELHVPEEVELELRTGDQSPAPIVDESQLSELQDSFSSLRWEHVHFSTNYGFGGGHNRLAALADQGHILVVNPDGVLPRSLITRLLDWAEKLPNWGVLEARQVPLELAKHVDFDSLVTDWASCACALIHESAWKQTGGFDELFFMYCEDVDLSWRIRSEGFEIYALPDVPFPHAKRPAEPTHTAKLYSPASDKLLIAKYLRARDFWAAMNQIQRSDNLQRNVLRHVRQRLPRLRKATAQQRAAATFNPAGSTTWRWIEIPLVENDQPDSTVLKAHESIEFFTKVSEGEAESALELGLTLALQEHPSWTWRLDAGPEDRAFLEHELPQSVLDRIVWTTFSEGQSLRLKSSDLLFSNATKLIAESLRSGQGLAFMSRYIRKVEPRGYFTVCHVSDKSNLHLVSGSPDSVSVIGLRVASGDPVEEVSQAEGVEVSIGRCAAEYALRSLKDRIFKLY